MAWMADSHVLGLALALATTAAAFMLGLLLSPCLATSAQHGVLRGRENAPRATRARDNRRKGNTRCVGPVQTRAPCCPPRGT